MDPSHKVGKTRGNTETVLLLSVLYISRKDEIVGELRPNNLITGESCYLSCFVTELQVGQRQGAHLLCIASALKWKNERSELACKHG